MKKSMFTFIALLAIIVPINAQENYNFDEFNLISTNTCDGIKCEHYAEGFRKYVKENGDYMWFKEISTDKYNMSNATDPDKYIWDTFKFHTKEGVVVERITEIQETNETLYLIKVTYPNGAFIVHTPQLNEQNYSRYGSLIFNAFKNMSYAGLWTYHNGSREGCFYYADSTAKPLPCITLYYYYPMFKKENRLYGLKKDGSLMAMAQEINGSHFFTNELDSIVSFSEGKLIYANGDYATINSRTGVLESANIHRNGNLITIKEINRKIVSVIKYDNGDKFVGQANAFAVNDKTGLMYGEENKFLTSKELTVGHSSILLAYPELYPWNGLMTKADGTSYEIKNGLTPEALAAQKKAEDAEGKAAYDELCKMFGKKYVDAAMKGEVIIGMPEGLLNSAFKTRLHEEGTNYKIYRISGFGWVGNTLTSNALKYSIWVTNGKVSDIKYW